MYLEMDDKDRAEDVVHEGLKVAAKMLDEDINPDDPNKALKAWWPSADAYRQMVEVETKISHPATPNCWKKSRTLIFARSSPSRLRAPCWD